MNLQQVYDSGCSERDEYLQKADALARLTLPELAPLGRGGNVSHSGIQNVSGPYHHDLPQPFSAAGTSAVTSLCSTMLSLLFPLNVPWFEVRVVDSTTLALAEAAGQAAGLDGALADLEHRMLDRLMADQYHAHLLEALFRIVIEGQVIVQKLPNRKGLRIIPLRSFTVKRFNGELYFTCFKEEMPNPDQPDKSECLYTYVDYQKREVWQQVGDQGQATRVALRSGDFIVATTRIPTMENYSTGLALRFFGAIYNINQMSFDMTRATSIAAKALLLINPESGFTANDIAKAVSGQALIGPEGMSAEQCFQWFSAAMKLNEWNWVYLALASEKQELAKNFALGLTQQPGLNTDRQTAESVRRLTQELDASVGSHAQVLQVTLQRPLAEAYLSDELGAAPDVLQKLKPIVTSGSSAMSRLAELERLIQWVGTFLSDPTFAQQIDTMSLFRHGAKIIGVPVDSFIRQAPQQGQQPPQGQAPAGGQAA
jgi:hypothetical protein